MIKLFDTHTHYDDEKYVLGGKSPYDVIENAFSENVSMILGASIDVESAKRQIELANRYDSFYASVGVHPENCPNVSEIPSTMELFSELIQNSKVKAVGEIGLDYYWKENPPKDCQKAWFEAQLELAEKHSLPVIVHDREAHGDCYDIICKYPNVIGVFHCYSGSREMAKELVKKGWYISFTGVVTFPNTQRLAEVVESIPDDRILLETDCPYLAPVPKRGKVNNSTFAYYTAEKLAEIRNTTVDKIIEQTLENGKRLFRIN
jgi:TatD DNase family protein